MSVKDVRKYYDDVYAQYKEMVDNLNEFTELANANMYPPEKIDEIKESIQPLMRNYEMLSYIIYLLNQPNRKNKKSRYERQNKKRVDNIPPSYSKEGVIAQNNSVLENLSRMR